LRAASGLEIPVVDDCTGVPIVLRVPHVNILKFTILQFSVGEINQNIPVPLIGGEDLGDRAMLPILITMKGKPFLEPAQGFAFFRGMERSVRVNPGV
jgi:hypothetical protein